MSLRVAALSALACVVTAPALAAKESEFGNVRAITADRLRTHLEFIASDELEGRDTPSKGLNIAAKYIATDLKLWGVKPAGDDGTYFQKVPLTRAIVDAAKTTLTVGGKVLQYGQDFYSGRSEGSGEGELVYVGYGYGLPGQPDDPYAKIDVKGKVLLALSGRPEGVTFADLRSGKALRPTDAAQKAGARGIIFIEEANDADWTNTAKASTESGGYRYETEQTTPALPTLAVRPAVASIFTGGKISADEFVLRMRDNKPGDPFALGPGATANFTVVVNPNRIYTQNVVGMIEGTDPKLKSEYVAIGAHYDHLGMASQGQDRIFNGADDDGSGTVSVLEIAHALATGKKPKRSVIFVWHAGEEKSLWGSKEFTTHPTVPIGSIVAQLNIDMIGRSKPEGDTNPRNKVLTGPNAIYLVGTTRMSTDLGTWAKDVNKRLYNLGYDFTYDDLNNPERIFFRSDHYSYAQKGIPILFWFDGVHEDYHRVSDEVAKIDFNKMETVARTVYGTMWRVANAKARPRVDKPLPAQ